MEVATLITYLQLFGIGFSFGIAGPCLFFCTPVLAAYIAASQKSPRELLSRISLFLTGRIAAYLILGYLAGLSGEFLRRVMNSWDLHHYSKLAAGIISIMLGIIILLRKDRCADRCANESGKSRSSFGFLVFGFLIGCAPCGPLAALLVEIALMSKSALQGSVYALSFGLGTFLSGLLVAGSVAGLLSLIPAKLLKFEKGRLIFRIICAALLISLGLSLLW